MKMAFSKFQPEITLVAQSVNAKCFLVRERVNITNNHKPYFDFRIINQEKNVLLNYIALLSYFL